MFCGGVLVLLGFLGCCLGWVFLFGFFLVLVICFGFVVLFVVFI